MCISRTLGAGGEDLGRVVAERLGFRYVDEEIVALAAEREGLDAADVASAEQRQSWLVRFLTGLGQGGDPELVALGGFAPSGESSLGASEHYPELIKDAIRHTANQGNAVIVAHAASHLLAGEEGVLRVLVTAPPEARSRRLAEVRGVAEKEATKLVADSDAGRADYLRRFYDVDRELPTQYDLVVNTEGIDAARGAALVVAACS